MLCSLKNVTRKHASVTPITTTPITELPMESLSAFKHWVLDEGIKPSAALRKLMEVYNCPTPDPSVPVQLVELTYPNIDLARQGFRFRIVDSAYPNSDPNQFSDRDFDEGIEELLKLPPGW